MFLRCFKSALTSSVWCCLLLPCAYVTECPEDPRTCSQSSSTAQSVGWAPGQRTKDKTDRLSVKIQIHCAVGAMTRY